MKPACTENPVDHPTLLRTPGEGGEGMNERVLPLALARYVVGVDAGDPRWRVVWVDGTGEEVYRGPAPVELLVSPAPF